MDVLKLGGLWRARARPGRAEQGRAVEDDAEARSKLLHRIDKCGTIRTDRRAPEDPRRANDCRDLAKTGAAPSPMVDARPRTPVRSYTVYSCLFFSLANVLI